MKSSKGYVTILGFRLFYKTFGKPDKGTIVCLHGGPGSTHDYILPLADLTKQGYRVIFYDDSIGGKPLVEKTLREHLHAILQEF